MMSSEDRSELASLYALNALDADEKNQADRLYANQSEFQAEVLEAEEAAFLLSYTAPVLPIAANLKDRLFQRIAAEIPPVEDTTIATLLEQAKTARWNTYQFVPGVEYATARVDSQTRQVESFVRGIGQIRFPAHRHAENEEIVVLEGDLVIGDQVYQAGDRIYSQPGTVHQPRTVNGCILYICTSLDDEIMSSSTD
jgi:hypothetical protein